MKAREELAAFDVTKYLGTPEERAAYLQAMWEDSDGDPALVAAALGDVARGIGMSEMARATGLAREALYKALSSRGNPELGTVLKVLRALGLDLSVQTGRPAMAPAFGEASTRSSHALRRRAPATSAPRELVATYAKAGGTAQGAVAFAAARRAAAKSPGAKRAGAKKAVKGGRR